MIILLTIILYLGICILLGIFSRKYIVNPEHFFSGYRLFRGLFVGLASAAAIMTAFGFVGGPGLVYKMGATSLWITLTQSLAFLFGAYAVGTKIVKLTLTRKIFSLADIVEMRYQSRKLILLFDLTLLLGIFAYLGTQVLGVGLVFSYLFGIPPEIGGLIAFSVIFIYSIIGGMVAHLVTNAFQGAIMVAAGIGALVGVLSLTGGIGGLFGPILEKAPIYADPLGKAFWPLALGWYWIFVIGNIAQPHNYIKYVNIKDIRDIRYLGLMGAVGYMLCCLLWIFMGYGSLFLLHTGKIPPLENPDFAAFYVCRFLPDALAGLLFAGLLAAAMSTADIFLVLAATAIGRDIPYALTGRYPKKSIFWGRVACLIVTAVAFIYGCYGGYMVAILGAFGWGYFTTILFPLLVIGMLWKGASKEGAIVTASLVLAMNVGFLILSRVFRITTPVPDYIITLLVGIIVFVIVSFFTKGAKYEKIAPEVASCME